MSNGDVTICSVGKEEEEKLREDEKENDEEDVGEMNDVPRYVAMATLAAAFFTMGVNLTLYGLTLPSIAENMNETLESLSPSLSIKGAGYLIGSALAGSTEGKVDIYAIVVTSLLFTGVGQGFTPVLLNKVGFFAFQALTSVGLGILETIGNVLCLQLWGKRVEPHLQFLHFTLCLGCAVTPLLAKPFLNENHLLNHTQNMTESLNMNSTNFSGTAAEYERHMIGNTSTPYVSIVFFLAVAMTTMVAVSFLLVRLLTKVRYSHSEQADTISQEGKSFRFGLIAFIFVFYLVYSGVEATFLTFLFAFLVSDVEGMRYNKDDASNLTALFYSAVTLGQFCAVFLSKKFSPTVILAGDLIAMIGSAILLCCLPFYATSAPRIFWVGLIISGFSGSSIYGSMFLWAERYITVNGRAASAFIVGASLGEMLLPLPVGQLIDNQPSYFLFFVLIYASILGLMFLVMIRVASWNGKRLNRENLNVSGAALIRSETQKSYQSEEDEQ